MSRQIFINSNINKNNYGFLLIDIMVGLTMFTVTGYFFFSMALNAACLLQTFIKSAIELSNQAFIARALALGISYDASFTHDGTTIPLNNYTTEVRSVTVFMHDKKKVVVDVVIVKSNTVDTVSRVCYMLKNV